MGALLLEFGAQGPGSPRGLTPHQGKVFGRLYVRAPLMWDLLKDKVLDLVFRGGLIW